ncbi:MAG TPA: tyrosine-type recombinase/integrase [Pyrinomonadaceae bacterium]|nr:tyrosine-type recombinase/integrase [Pyrinomonadaceae bacterium]
MAKERTGYCFTDKEGRWYARVTLTDRQGRRRNIKRRAKDEKDANKILKALAREIEDKGEKGLDGAQMTFANLASYFEQRYVKPAEYVDGRKVAGLRSAVKAQSLLKTLKEYLGEFRLPSITYGEIEHYKSVRLKTPTRTMDQRSIASVNRELALLRRMLNVAVREGWTQKNPFSMGDPLVSPADERQRERILTREEEAQLIAACVGRRAHLRPIIIAAIDTGCRKGELLKLRWRDVDFAEGLITIVAFNTKTLRARQVSITTRLSNELWPLWEASGQDSEALVFGLVDNVKRSFTGARAKAGLDDLRFHDLRHTHGSRLDELGFSLAKIGAQLGHTVMQTTLRYVNRDRAGVKQIASALDSYNAIPLQTTEESQVIN